MHSNSVTAIAALLACVDFTVEPHRFEYNIWMKIFRNTTDNPGHTDTRKTPQNLTNTMLSASVAKNHSCNAANENGGFNRILDTKILVFWMQKALA
jgi:hypothetical protein